MFQCCSFVSFVESHNELEKFLAIRREQLEVHNSLSVEMKSAALVCGRFPFLPLGQNKASGDTFVNALPLCAVEVDSYGCYPPPSFNTLPLFPSLLLLPLLILPPPSPCIPPVTGLTDTRHRQVLRPRWIRFPLCQGIVLRVRFFMAWCCTV